MDIDILERSLCSRFETADPVPGTLPLAILADTDSAMPFKHNAHVESKS